jgi:heme-degrading monooxygenase HmoA
MARQLREQPGFHSYTLVRTDDLEVVAVTMFETAAQSHAAFEAVGSETRDNMHHTTSGQPEHRAGEVILHEMVSG